MCVCVCRKMQTYIIHLTPSPSPTACLVVSLSRAKQRRCNSRWCFCLHQRGWLGRIKWRRGECGWKERGKEIYHQEKTSFILKHCIFCFLAEMSIIFSLAPILSFYIFSLALILSFYLFLISSLLLSFSHSLSLSFLSPPLILSHSFFLSFLFPLTTELD